VFIIYVWNTDRKAITGGLLEVFDDAFPPCARGRANRLCNDYYRFEYGLLRDASAVSSIMGASHLLDFNRHIASDHA